MNQQKGSSNVDLDEFMTEQQQQHNQHLSNNKNSFLVDSLKPQSNVINVLPPELFMSSLLGEEAMDHVNPSSTKNIFKNTELNAHNNHLVKTSNRKKGSLSNNNKKNHSDIQKDEPYYYKDTRSELVKRGIKRRNSDSYSEKLREKFELYKPENILMDRHYKIYQDSSAIPVLKKTDIKSVRRDKTSPFTRFETEMHILHQCLEQTVNEVLQEQDQKLRIDEMNRGIYGQTHKNIELQEEEKNIASIIDELCGILDSNINFT